MEKAIAALHLDDRTPEAAAKSLMELAGPEATLGELAALEALMQRFMQGGQITTSTVRIVCSLQSSRMQCTARSSRSTFSYGVGVFKYMHCFPLL